LTSGSGSFSSYRKQLHGANPPCVPYLGVYQSDLTFIGDGNPDKLENGYINFFKRRLVAEVIKEAQTYQQKPYNLVEVKSIMDWLRGQDVSNLDENTIYSVSLIIEPREDSPTVKRKSGSNSLSRSKSGKIMKSKSLLSVQAASAPSHASWNPEGDNTNHANVGSLPNRKISKLNQFFGSDTDFSFYEKYAADTKQVGPKSILVDTPLDSKVAPAVVSSKHPQQATSALDLTPEQIIEYKKQAIRQFQQTHSNTSPNQQNLENEYYEEGGSGQYEGEYYEEEYYEEEGQYEENQSEDAYNSPGWF